MADIIQLLPDAIANQIAAGEVIQRPASVVKELMENAIDAGSTSIKLIIKDSGKTLIQVIDDGCGMSETDARMSFERHATSKIRAAKDLFAIRTMGFRGEAMASIAAIAQVELKTRRRKDELGTRIVIEGSEVKSQEPCQCTAGTQFSIKNLFYNVPARRNFLKSNTVEMRHILDEFQRVAIANPDIFFSLYHNNSEIFHLPPGNLRQRIVGVFGSNTNKKLVPIQEETDVTKIHGFVGKPEYAKKTRGQQYFFVNNRFIKSGYLNHAVVSAYEELISKEVYPLYVIFLEIDPSRIDINVHPTKQEIKFDDERLIYNYLKVTVKHALGQFNVAPSLDFDTSPNFVNYTAPKNKIERPPISNQVPSSFGVPKQSALQKNNQKNWQKLYEGLDPFEDSKKENSSEPLTIESEWTDTGTIDDTSQSFTKQKKEPYQIHNKYIVSQIKSGFLLIDQQAAHERILFEYFLNKIKNQEQYTQAELFPKTINLPPADVPILKEILSDINKMGFDIKEFGNDTFIMHGIPAELDNAEDEEKLIESLIEQYKLNIDLSSSIQERLAIVMAMNGAMKKMGYLTVEEMQSLIDRLFACEIPFKSPRGKNCFITYNLQELQKRFEG